MNKCIQILEKFKEETFIDNQLYDNKSHLLFAFTCKNYTNNNNISVKFIKKNMKFINDLNDKVKPLYKTLNKRRIYNISDDIGCFQLFDEKKFNKKKAFCENWEYYANFSPIWKKRMNFEFKNKNPVWKNIDNMEKFYEEYNYEPDEKCDLILKYNKSKKISEWLKKVWREDYEKSCYNSQITY